MNTRCRVRHITSIYDKELDEDRKIISNLESNCGRSLFPFPMRCNLSIILMLWMTRWAIVNLLYFSRQTYYVDIWQTIILLILHITTHYSANREFNTFWYNFSDDLWEFYSVILHQPKVMSVKNSTFIPIEEIQSYVGTNKLLTMEHYMCLDKPAW